jgi:hypothetical protein
LGILEISNMVYSHWLLYIYTFVTGGMSLYICRHFFINMLFKPSNCNSWESPALNSIKQMFTNSRVNAIVTTNILICCVQERWLKTLIHAFIIYWFRDI